MGKKLAKLRPKKPQTWQGKLKLGLELAFLLSALLVVIMPFSGMNTFARGNDSSRVFAGLLHTSMLQKVGASEPEQQALNEQVEQVAALAAKEDSDVKKVKAVHDYLVRSTIYDYANYSREKVPMVSYTAYGALVRGTAVCQGYSTAFQMILEKVGIPCVTVVSDEMKHAWNMVQVDGEWYHVDTTWDDPVPDLGNHVSYDSFLVSDARLQDEQHEYSNWVVRDGNTDREAPKATSRKYDAMTQRDWMYGAE